MSASVNDKITDVRNAARPTSARATGTRSTAGTSLSCDDLTGWPTASKVHFVTYQIDSNSNPVAGTQLDCRGIVSGNSIGSFAVLDGNDTGNSIGDVVEMLPTASWAQDLADALTAQHSRTGAHVGINNTGGMTTDTLTVSGASTLTGGTILPAGDIGTADLAAASVTADKLSTGAKVGGAGANESTASTSYVDLATVTDAVTVTIGANGLALVILTAFASNTNGNNTQIMGFAGSGANIIATDDFQSLQMGAISGIGNFQNSWSRLLTGLSPGATTFKAKYKTTGGTASFQDRYITVIPL